MRFRGFIPEVRGLLGLCVHEFEITSRRTIDLFENENSKYPIRTERRIIKECKHCNEIKVIKHDV